MTARIVSINATALPGCVQKLLETYTFKLVNKPMVKRQLLQFLFAAPTGRIAIPTARREIMRLLSETFASMPTSDQKYLADTLLGYRLLILEENLLSPEALDAYLEQKKQEIFFKIANERA